MVIHVIIFSFSLHDTFLRSMLGAAVLGMFRGGFVFLRGVEGESRNLASVVLEATQGLFIRCFLKSVNQVYII